MRMRYLRFVLIFLCLSSCGVYNHSIPQSSCLIHGAGIPCGNIYTEDLLTVPKTATIDALKDYLREKKNLSKDSPFRKIDDGRGDLNDLMRGLTLVKNAYQVNPIFALALSAIESGWGTSELAGEKYYNLWGWNAPYDGKEGGSRFKSWSHGFNIVFRSIKADYLSPKGKYHKSCAPPEYFAKYVRKGGCSLRDCGASLAGMNCKYALDNNWAKKIREQMDNITSFINARCHRIKGFPIEVPSIEITPPSRGFSFPSLTLRFRNFQN